MNKKIISRYKLNLLRYTILSSNHTLMCTVIHWRGKMFRKELIKLLKKRCRWCEGQNLMRIFIIKEFDEALQLLFNKRDALDEVSHLV